MRMLFCCEFYYPSVGGVAEVMRQIAERMAAGGTRRYGRYQPSCRAQIRDP